MEKDGFVGVKNKFLIPNGPYCYFGDFGKANFRPCPYWKLCIKSEEDDKKYEYGWCDYLSIGDEELENASLLFRIKCCFINISYEYNE